MTAADSQTTTTTTAMMTMTTTKTNTNTNTTANTNNTAQQPQRKEKKRRITPEKSQEEENRRAARIVLEAACLLLTVGARTAEGGRDDDAWQSYHVALNAKLSEPSAVAAARNLFRTLVGLATRQHPGTAVAGYVYELSALLDSFLLAQHPHRFSYEAMRRMGRAEEEQEAQIALMDAGAALAETFEALLRALLLRSTTKTTPQTTILARMQPLTAELLPQLRAYQGVLAAWTAVAPLLHVLSARLSSILEDRDLLRTRQRLCDLLAYD
jgi:hypothetical protein